MRIDPGNFQACLGAIAERGRLGQQEALDLLEHVAERGDAMRASGVADPFVEAAHELAQRLKESARQDRLDALRNATIRNHVVDQVARNGGLAKAELTLRSVLHGTNAGERDNIESMWKGNAAGWQAQLSHQLRKAGLEKAAISGQIDGDIASELWALNAGTAGRPTGDSPARMIADAVKPLLDHMRDRLNAAGARIGDAVDYVTHTVHDPAKMRRAAGPGMTPDEAFVAWWSATEPKLAERTFADLVPQEGESQAAARTRFGRSVFDALVSGVHLKFGGADEAGYVPPAFEGTHNLAQRLSQSRVLFWRDGEAWNQYMQAYGAPASLTHGVMMALDKGARQLALMEKLGTNPAGNFNLIVRRIEETHRSDLDGLKAFQAKKAGLDAVMAHLDGSANIPANEMAARIAASVRTMETVSSLGGVGITHFASIWPTVTSEMAHHGVGRLEMMGNMASALLKGKGSAERQEILADLGAYSNGMTREMFSRWQAEDMIPGRISALAGTFMKYTGIHWVFDHTQAAIRETAAHQLGRNVGKSFADLDPHLAQMIGKYGIGRAEWDLLRAVPDLPTADGLAYLTPREGLRVDAGGAEALLRSRGLLGEDATTETIAKGVTALRNSLSDKLLSYYGDAAAHGVVTPGVRERAMVLGAERPGTLGAELRRFVMQFKMWPLAAANQVLGREIHMSLGARDAAWNIGTLLALTASGGYLRMVVNDLATGRPVRDVRDPRTLVAALAQGGGLGILGDFLFGEVNRMGGGLLDSFAGPVAGDADRLYQIFNRFRQDTGAAQPHSRGRYSDIWPDLAHFAVRHIPFANLVYLKGVIDYMLWYHLYEAASPGWWERTNRRLTKEQGRAITGYTPGGGVPGGVPGVYGAGWGRLMPSGAQAPAYAAR
jgi:hypothetical protein